ncbi:MAG: peptide-methionine (S)-S-oxide reductase MsrA [Anaerolineales bacterium]
MTSHEVDQGSQKLETATLGGGCFWCFEPMFEALTGVHKVTVGYAGGELAEPTYRQVGSGTTGHAEVVQIEFDPQLISYREILEVFFSVHDPTTADRQGADTGTQYRSLVLYHSPEQQETAEALIRELEAARTWDSPIVTQVQPFRAFYLGEDYHQDYYENNPSAGYCRIVIDPKLAKFRKRYADKLKREPSPAG